MQISTFCTFCAAILCARQLTDVWKARPSSSYVVENVVVNGEQHADYDYSEGRLHINNLALSLNDDWQILLNP